jgi:cellulose synthase/poly-beta-1,6-N-acetylglucosamine synthase-like glycosyltransferase
MNWLISFSFLVSLLYLLRLLQYRKDWDRLPLLESASGAAGAGLSVVVAFRNEVLQLPALLNALASQKYPANLWEVILVDDHSDDGSSDLVRAFIPKHANFRLLSCTAGEGKKAALHTGIGQVSFPFVVTTDADCVMGPMWLSAMGAAFTGDTRKIVMGPVVEEESEGFITGFSRLEFLSLVASGAASAAGGRPIFCNGANLAYPVALFRSFTDPMGMDLQSGDDTLFMLRAKHRGVPVRFLKDRAALVRTRASEGWGSFFSRRVRWAFKPSMYADGDVLLTALLVTLQALILLVCMAATLTGRSVWLFPSLILVKYVADTIFLKGYAAFCGIRLPWLKMLAFEAIYPAYIVWVLLLGVAGRNRWKGRVNRKGLLFNSRVRKEI